MKQPDPFLMVGRNTSEFEKNGAFNFVESVQANNNFRRQLTIPQRKDYIRAVKCMHKIPGIYRDIVPSSLTLWEDFAAVHKLQTPFIHFEVCFMGLSSVA
jgi:hypothetical protein